MMKDKTVRAADVMDQLDRIIENVKAAGGVRDEQLDMIRAVTRNAIDLAPEAAPRESADEMFRKIGYEKMETIKYPIYGNKSEGVKIVLITDEKMAAVKTDMMLDLKALNGREALAVARLIEEREAEHEKMES